MTLDEWVDLARGASSGFPGGAGIAAMFATLWEFIPEGGKTLETGCGLTTGVFFAKARSHTILDPQQKKIESLRQIKPERCVLTEHPMLSKEAWPRVVMDCLKPEYLFDVILLDGCDQRPDTLIDAVFAVALLKPGGCLMLDDLEQPGPEDAVKYLGSIAGMSGPTNVDSRCGLWRKHGNPG